MRELVPAALFAVTAVLVEPGDGDVCALPHCFLVEVDSYGFTGFGWFEEVSSSLSEFAVPELVEGIRDVEWGRVADVPDG